MTEQIDYDPNTVLEALNNKADRDLNNVTDGTYQVLTTKNITNSITKIPQDIKLELNNGTLTLKAGSKVYDSSGNTINVTEDKINNTTSEAQMYLCVSINSGSLFAGYMTGGTITERPSEPVNYAVYYNTTTNVCEFYANDTWTEVSLPIAIVTRSANGFTSIDQVFNGFGYIGSTIFALPGVEGLIPNGRNTDGSLNNKSFKTTSVLTANALFNANLASIVVNSTFLTMVTDNNVRYDNNNNFNFLVNNNDKYFAAFVGTVSIKDLKIAEFSPKTTLRILDRNDKEEIISWGIPDYSAGISVTYPYTAPSDGVIVASPQFRNGETTVIYIDDVQIFYMYGANIAYDSKCLLIPVNKGNKITLSRAYASGGDKFYPMKGVV